MTIRKKSVACGDWHHSWGLGTNKIGKLSLTEAGEEVSTYKWKGHSQGRHGSVWNKGAESIVTHNEKTGELTVEAIKGDVLRNKGDILAGIATLTKTDPDSEQTMARPSPDIKSN